MTNHLTAEQRSTLLEYKRLNPEKSGRQIAKVFGFHHKTVNRLLRTPNVGAPVTELKETHEHAGDTWNISLPKTRIHTLAQLIEHFQIDESVWLVERLTCNKWELAAKGENGFEVEPLYQVKAVCKRKVRSNVHAEIESLREIARSFARTPDQTYAPDEDAAYMLEVNVPDFHAGKLAWGEETGHKNWDIKIAVDTWWRSFNKLLERVRGYNFEKILFVVGNDLLNSDNIQGSTTTGTPQSNDGRYHKVFKTVRDLKIESIERLRRIAPTTVIPIPGNHDFLTTWHLGDSLWCYFSKYSDVTVDLSPNPRKYYRYGDVMLMFCHKPGKDYPLLMATERPEMFGQTKYREAHTGHLHQTSLKETHGVRVRILPALCPPDSWHAENGYVGNIRSAEAYIWHKTDGLVATVFHHERD